MHDVRGRQRPLQRRTNKLVLSEHLVNTGWSDPEGVRVWVTREQPVSAVHQLLDYQLEELPRNTTFIYALLIHKCDLHATKRAHAPMVDSNDTVPVCVGAYTS